MTLIWMLSAGAAPTDSGNPTPVTHEVDVLPLRTRTIPREGVHSEDIDPSPIEDFSEPPVEEVDVIDDEHHSENEAPECNTTENRGHALAVHCSESACEIACGIDAPGDALTWVEVEARRNDHATTIAEMQLGCSDDAVLYAATATALEPGVYTVHVRADDAHGEWQSLVAMLDVTATEAAWIPVRDGAAVPTAADMMHALPESLRAVLARRADGGGNVTLGAAVFEGVTP